MNLNTNWKSDQNQVYSIPSGLPPEYSIVLERLGAGEGFIGQEFVRLYNPDLLEKINIDYEISTYLPDLLIFGSNGCGEAYCFKTEPFDPSVYRVPFIPFDPDYIEKIADNLLLMVQNYSEIEPKGTLPVPNPETSKKEVTERHPIVLGGNPNDLKNKVFLSYEQHIQAVVYWNKIYLKVKQQHAKEKNQSSK